MSTHVRSSPLYVMALYIDETCVDDFMLYDLNASIIICYAEASLVLILKYMSSVCLLMSCGHLLGKG